MGGKEVGLQSYAINSSVSLMPWQPQGNFAEIAGLEYRQKRLFLEEKSPENVSLMTFSPISVGINLGIFWPGGIPYAPWFVLTF